MISSEAKLLSIAVICLLAISLPTVGIAAADEQPDPSLSVDIPETVTVGESFTVDVSAYNYEAAGGEYSTITVSSPTLDEYDDGEQVSPVSNTFSGDAVVKEPGDTIYDADGQSLSAEYVLVEGSTGASGEWSPWEDRELSVEFTPEEAGTFEIYVRTTLNDPDGEKITDPAFGETDQQGFTVERHVVEVREEPDVDAEIRDVDVDGGDYERSDAVDSAVTVENTGNREHTYFVGYGVYDGIGRYYDNEESTGTTVALEPGETRTVDVSWSVEDDARAGYYDARVSVWKESDRDALDTRLADGRTDNAFRVREEPDIDAAVRDVDVDGGTFRYGEVVDGEATVENTGNREHTYFVGYSVYDESDRDYDNGDSTGTAVTLSPGETRAVDVSWTVQNGVEAGHYDARVSVWKESDRDGLYTRLADARRSDAFAVRPIETVGFTVSTKSSIDGYEFSGEPIADATITIDGKTLTTDSDGDASIDLPVDTYEYTAEASGYSGSNGQVRMSSGTYHAVGVHLVRENVGVLETNVIDQDGSPLAANTYRILVDGERAEPNARGELLLEAGTHTVAVEPTEFGESRGVSSVEKQVTVAEGERTTVDLVAVSEEHTLSVDVSAEGGGVTVGSEEAPVTDVERTYEEGETVTVTARPTDGYEFDHWAGDYPSGQRTSASLTLEMTDATSLTPRFSETNGETVTVVGYDLETGTYDNYTLNRGVDRDVDADSASLPPGTSWSDVSVSPTDSLKRNVTETEHYPWSAIGEIAYDFNGGCTATVVESNHVVTAGHCVYEDGQWVTEKQVGAGTIDDVQFMPGRDAMSFPFDSAEVIHAHTYQQWIDGENQAYDVAVLTLDRPVGEETGTFGYEGRPADDPVYTDDSLHMTGYPASSAFYVNTTDEQWDLRTDGQGTDVRFQPDCASNDRCQKVATGGAFDEYIYPGNSGGPVWQSANDGRPTLVSVVSTGPSGLGKPVVDPISDGMAVRISETKYSDVSGMIRRGNDISLPLTADLTATPETVTTDESVTFDASETTNGDGTVRSYEWDVDGDGDVEETTASATASHTYEAAGTYTATVTAVGEDGETATDEVEITVESSSVELSDLSLDIENVTECGLSCREVRYGVENPTDATLEGLTADVEISTGGRALWETRQSFEEVPPGRVTSTATVTLDPDELYAIEQNDRRVTLTIEVAGGGENRTVSFERQL